MRKRSRKAIIVENTFDYDKLAEAIVKAQNKATDTINAKKQKTIESERQEIIQKRKEYLKEKDFSYIKCRLWKGIRTFFNRLRVLKRILFMPKKDLKLFSAIDGLIITFTSGLLFIVRLILYFFAALLVLSVFWGCNILIALPIAFLIFTIAQLIRIAQYEVERIKDRDYLLALFVGILTIFSIIISILTLFPDSDILQIKQLLTEIKDIL